MTMKTKTKAKAETKGKGKPTAKSAGRTKAAAAPKTAEPGFGWRRFLIYGILWWLIFAAAGTGWRAACWVYDQVQTINTFVHPDRWISPDSGGAIRNWIKKNLPRAGAGNRDDVAAAFEEVAGMLRREEITTVQEAFAEAVARIQPVAPRPVWGAFLTRLGQQIQKEAEGVGPDRIADIFETAAGAISAKSVRIAPTEVPAPPDGNHETGEDPAEPLPAVQSLLKAASPKEADDTDEAKSAPGGEPVPSGGAAEDAGICPGGNCPRAAAQNGCYYPGGWRWF